MNNVQISIIVPIYNTENYLKRCINSIINQNITNFEVILINDGSTDNSRKICEEYSKLYENIRLINQENLGQAYARNLGITEAKGKYIGFVDSDDYIDKNMYSNLVNIAESNRCDIAVCSDEKVYDNSDVLQCSKYAQSIIEEDKEKIIKMYLLQQISSYSCDKIFKKELLIKNKIKNKICCVGGKKKKKKK
ncbi:glycosyltransferase, partial [Clostridium butyricum]|uniref:glycosyltransferase n=1 Tax=Clostridium butyricum TaxID=1492 RepID=UPI002103AAC4